MLGDGTKSLPLREVEGVEVAFAQTQGGLERDVENFFERLGMGDRTEHGRKCLLLLSERLELPRQLGGIRTVHRSNIGSSLRTLAR